MTVVRTRFRTLMGRFATGVTVVTAVDGDIHFGMTVNAFCSVSLDPCLVLVSLREASATCEAIRRTGTYAVNILTAEQRSLAERFARHELDPAQRFAGVSCETRLTGAPLFTEALAQIECRVVAEYAGGDHTLLIGEVVGLESQAEADEVAEAGASPLVFYRSAYATLTEESLPPAVVPHRAAAAAAAGKGWTRGIGRLWDGLFRRPRSRGAPSGLASALDMPAEAAMLDVPHSLLHNGATAPAPAHPVVGGAESKVPL